MGSLIYACVEGLVPNLDIDALLEGGVLGLGVLVAPRAALVKETN